MSGKRKVGRRAAGNSGLANAWNEKVFSSRDWSPLPLSFPLLIYPWWGEGERRKRDSAEINRSSNSRHHPQKLQKSGHFAFLFPSLFGPKKLLCSCVAFASRNKEKPSHSRPWSLSSLVSPLFPFFHVQQQSQQQPSQICEIASKQRHINSPCWLQTWPQVSTFLQASVDTL